MIGIIGATDFEMSVLLSKMTVVKKTEHSGFEFFEGSVFDTEIVAVKCGIGKVFMGMCTVAMCNKYDTDVILNIGAAGGLRDDMKKGDIVLVTGAVQYDMDTTAFGDPLGLISGINMVKLPGSVDSIDSVSKKLSELGIKYYIGDNGTADLFCTKKEVKDMLVSKFDCYSVDMECGAFLQACFILGKKGESVKIISDSVNDSSNDDYNEFTGSVGDRVMDFLKIRLSI